MKSIKLKKSNLLYLMLLILFIPILFVFMNFDRGLNVDYENYKNNFIYNWNQFELGFEYLFDIISFFNDDFDFFWTAILIIEIILISFLYNSYYLLLFAIPNLLYLSNSLLGTQIRFALASLIILNIFNYFFYSKKFVFYSLISIIFHNANIIIIFLTNYIKLFFKFNRRLNLIDILYFLICAFVLLIIYFFTKSLLISIGYYYYVDSIYNTGRSLSGLLFLIFEFFVLIILLLNKNGYVHNYFRFVILGLFLIVIALIFNEFSVISGRVTLLYLLIQPFIMVYFFNIAKKNKLLFLFFIVYMIANIVKIIPKFI